MAQTNEFYTIESALESPEKVHTLFLNYSFIEIVDLPKEINQLENLEELIIFPRMGSFPKIENNKIVQNKLDNSPLESIEVLPDQLSQCSKLKIIDLSMSEIKCLPKKIIELKKLEKLILNGSKIDINIELNKIIQLEKLKELQIINCSISKENFDILKSIPDLKVISKLSELKELYKETENVDIQLHDTYIVFKNNKEANQFLNSMPHGLSKIVTLKEYKKEE